MASPAFYIRRQPSILYQLLDSFGDECRDKMFDPRRFQVVPEDHRIQRIDAFRRMIEALSEILNGNLMITFHSVIENHLLVHAVFPPPPSGAVRQRLAPSHCDLFRLTIGTRGLNAPRALFLCTLRSIRHKNRLFLAIEILSSLRFPSNPLIRFSCPCYQKNLFRR